jgi:hypothetical protein
MAKSHFPWEFGFPAKKQKIARMTRLKIKIFFGGKFKFP